MEPKDFSVVLSGGDIRPETIPVHELAELISSFEQGLVADLKAKNPDINTDELIIGLVAISSNSAHFKFSSSLLSVTLATFVSVSAAIASGNVSTLPDKTQFAIRTFQNYTNKRKCTASFLVGDNNATPIAQISEGTNIDFSPQNSCQGETIIYGQLERIGGSKPKASIRTKKGETVICDISRGHAELLAPFLYKMVSVRGKAEWSSPDLTVSSFSVYEIGEYRNSSKVKCLQEIGKIASTYWDNVENVLDEVSKIRGGEV